MSKILITSGCSFSECISEHITTWPKHLYNILVGHGYKQHISCAMGSQGNGLISRHAIYKVIKSLETYNPQDILVGIMWSNCDRFDYRCDHPSLLSFGNENKHGWMVNPLSFVENAPKNWVIGNVHWDSIEFQTYVKYFHSDIGASILSLEHILRMQYFLKLHNIPYFFTDFVDNNIVSERDKDNEEVKYLINQLDRSQYLPVTSEHGWLIKHSETKEQYIKDHNGNRWVHPKTHHHKEFIDGVVYPWLRHKKYL